MELLIKKGFTFHHTYQKEIFYEQCHYSYMWIWIYYDPKKISFSNATADESKLTSFVKACIIIAGKL